jgi:hypothetical protein
VFLGGVMGVLKYLIIGVVVVAAVVAAALTLLPPKPHRAPIQYIGSPSGFEGFVPSDQTVSYKGSQDPVGDLILSNGTKLPNVIWNGQYASTIIQNHNEIEQLNNQWVGELVDESSNQRFVPLQDVYVIKGRVPVEQVTLNGQEYYVIHADEIRDADIAGFYTYQGWINNFIAAMNTPGTTPAVLPIISPVFDWENLTGIVAYQTMLYQAYGLHGAGGAVLVLPNGTIIPYGITDSPLGGMSLFNFTAPYQVYNPPS